MVFQKPTPFPMSIFDNVAFGVRLYEKVSYSELAARVEWALRKAALWKEVKDILKHNGGLLTEFGSAPQPDKHNFPTRNRIVAGMSDAVIVIESGIKGGSMVTAELANGYNKDVFAFPGRITDQKSIGCNFLIKNNKAMLVSDAAELIQIMGWEEQKKSKIKKQKELFIQLSAEEKIITDLLKMQEAVSIDELNLNSGLSSSAVAAAILNLELQNVVQSLPGKMYALW